MSFQIHSSIRRVLLGMGIAIGAMQAALADDGRPGARVPPMPKYRQECAACHVAYPPGMLPAASWTRIMNNLPHHFGTDASLDEASVRQITAWLEANAGTYKRVRETPPDDRITRSAWFIRKHDEIAPSVWKRASIKSASNCAACHTRADQGDFDEDTVRIPR